MRALVIRRGKSVTAVPGGRRQADGQSSHVQITLKHKAGAPLFCDMGQKNGESQTFGHFLGALQAYIGDMTLIVQPTGTSHRRFAPGTFAPQGVTWGSGYRTTCIRRVRHTAASLRVENRQPGADATTNLTTAAKLAAGGAGILTRIAPDPEVMVSGYSQKPARGFARSTPEAISRLGALDFARDWLGGRFVDGVTSPRKAQHDTFRRKVPDVELHRFYDLG